MGTATASFLNLFAIAKVKRRMEMAIECRIEHVVVILIKDIRLSWTQKTHATAILQLKIVPVILTFILKTERLQRKV